MSRRRYEQIINQMGAIVGDMHTLHFRVVQQRRRGWEPLMNVYRYPDHFQICLELAGVSPRDIRIGIDGARVTISGVRHWPDLRCQRTGSHCRGTTLMEIEEGEFFREIELPETISTEPPEVITQQGLVWIRLQR